MVSIVTHVESSNLRVIGENIGRLSQLHPFVVPDDAKEAVVSIKLSHQHTQASDGSPAVGADSIAAIADALSMSVIERNASNEWETVRQYGMDTPDPVEQVADIRLVFEGQNEKVIVVPNQDALEYATQAPPLAEGGYAVAVVANDVAQLLRDKVDEILSSPAAPLAPQKAAIVSLIDSTIAELFPAQSASEKLNTLFEQLGSYTCRQCG